MSQHRNSRRHLILLSKENVSQTFIQRATPPGVVIDKKGHSNPARREAYDLGVVAGRMAIAENHLITKLGLGFIPAIDVFVESRRKEFISRRGCKRVICVESLIPPVQILDSADQHA